ncbi:hypothetical protein COPEUT_00436 [Coprococcus eutactus ATCC 27759]|nr:hypothetical protein COPEUT_00436 [Coprococcus eutactus ATCC 27759]
MHPERAAYVDQILILNIWWEQLMIYHMKTTPEPCAI